ncbi:regulator of G-protein signaling 5b isoform X2 [Festucalex cinctus]
MSLSGPPYKKAFSHTRVRATESYHTHKQADRPDSSKRPGNIHRQPTGLHLNMCRGLELLPITCLERAKELKALFGSLLHKSDHSVPVQPKKSDAHSVDECLKWKDSFEKLLSSQNGLCLFRAFLVSEFSEENIAFYLACEDYRTTKPSKMSLKAKEIFDEFISTDAPREVNLDHVTKAIAKENIEHPTLSCFDLAQAKIYTLMEKDCYPRFLKSLSQQSGQDRLSDFIKNCATSGRQM